MPITFEARHLSSSSRHEQTFETEFGEAQETARKVLGAVVEARSEHLQQWSSQDLFRYVEHCGQKVEQFGSEGRTYQFNLASTLFAIERANIYKHVLDYGSFTSEGEKQAFQKDWKCHLAQAQQSLSDILLSASDEKVRRLSSHLAGALLVWPPQKGGPDMEQFQKIYLPLRKGEDLPPKYVKDISFFCGGASGQAVMIRELQRTIPGIQTFAADPRVDAGYGIDALALIPGDAGKRPIDLCQQIKSSDQCSGFEYEIMKPEHQTWENIDKEKIQSKEALYVEQREQYVQKLQHGMYKLTRENTSRNPVVGALLVVKPATFQRSLHGTVSQQEEPGFDMFDATCNSALSSIFTQEAQRLIEEIKYHAEDSEAAFRPRKQPLIKRNIPRAPSNM